MPCLFCQTPEQACTHFELLSAMYDVRCVSQEYGTSVEFRLRFENQLVRDKYNSIKRFNNTQTSEATVATSLSMKAYPVTFNPSQKELDKAGIRERTEVVIYTPRIVWLETSLDIDEIDMERATVVMLGSTYEIRDKARQSQFREDFLYYVFGLNKK